MWIWPTKKQIKKEMSKISKAFSKRDKTISKNTDDIRSNSIKIARLEGVISVLLKQKSPEVSKNLPKSQGNIETKVINRLRRSKKSLIMSEIAKLSVSLSVIDMFYSIVKERGLCSKASFYRYIKEFSKVSKVPEVPEIETSKEINPN